MNTFKQDLPMGAAVYDLHDLRTGQLKILNYQLYKKGDVGGAPTLAKNFPLADEYATMKGNSGVKVEEFLVSYLDKHPDHCDGTHGELVITVIGGHQPTNEEVQILGYRLMTMISNSEKMKISKHMKKVKKVHIMPTEAAGKLAFA